jgi:acetyl esterase/lipase
MGAAGGALVLLGSISVGAQIAQRSTVGADETVSSPAVRIPYSQLASPQARRNFGELAAGSARLLAPAADVNTARRRVDEFIIPRLARLRARFPVTIRPETMGGVLVDVVTPVRGTPRRNANRVLVNLHGGGFIVGARYGGQMESVPIASLGGFKVITVDYRMGPEYRFPAASEDVGRVYRALIHHYRPENIGIYGCSAGGMLTAQSVAWFQRNGFPRPGAIGMFDGAAVLDGLGDSAYFGSGLSGGPVPSPSPNNLPYFTGIDLSDPAVSPARDASILSRFPPSLLISGTRDPLLSSVVFTHSRLVALGVEADLHIWEGAGHCSFAQPIADPDVPETQQAWSVITHFFDSHLGTPVHSARRRR